MKQLRIADYGLRRLSIVLTAMVMVVVLAGAAAGTGYIDNYTLLNAKTATGAGSIVLDLQQPTYAEFNCQVTWSGTAPTNTVVALDGSINTTFGDDHLGTQTITATGQSFQVADKLVRYIRGNYISKTDGDATTAVTLKCSAVSR